MFDSVFGCPSENINAMLVRFEANPFYNFGINLLMRAFSKRIQTCTGSVLG